MISIERARLTKPLRTELDSLDHICFGDVYPKKDTETEAWWTARTRTGTPLGFAGAKLWDPDGCVYLCRAGVIATARGAGLQRRLIRVRLAWARRIGADAAYTYTVSWNHASNNSLIACGFKLWSPGYAWAGREGVLYWWHGLGKSPVPR